MSVRARALTALAATLVVVAQSRAARAEVSVETQMGARRIQVGDATQFQITVLASEGETPSSPRLPAVAGLDISGPSIGSRTQVSINNGRMVQQVGITATWTVRGVKPGNYRLGPATIEAGGQRHQGNMATLEVVPQGQLPRQPQRSFDPFNFLDPFGQGSPFPRGLLGPDFDQEQEEPTPVPEEYRVDRAQDPIAFLRATVSPKHPVVGEQVTLKLYAYGGRGLFNVGNLVDFTHADFLDYSSKDDGDTNDIVRVPIGDDLFLARKVRELALFPLHAGRLAIGAATLTFQGGRYHTPGVTRTTAPLEIDVVEPPLDGRPVGYRVGNVGNLKLTAAVDPRKVTAGDSVAVVARLEGTGSIPTVLRIPEQRGVEWLPPTHVDNVRVENSLVRGDRTFSYVVKLSEPGKVELGQLNLPYWDPKLRSYQLAKTELGRIEVAPNPHPKPVASTEGNAATLDPLALKPRRTLDGYREAEPPFTEGSRFWFLIFGAPIAVALSGVGLELGGRFRRSRSRALSSPERLAQEALRAAESAARGSEIAKTAAAIERALFLAIEAGTSLKARAFLKSDLKAALGEAGVPAGVIERTLTLLDACESARFTGKTGDLPPKELYAQARSLVGELSRRRKKP